MTVQPDRRSPGSASSGPLPPVVERYLKRAVSDRDRVPQLVRVTQQGRMRTKPGGRWMRFHATEDLQVRSVAFSWRARFTGALSMLTAVDQYAAGAGRLRVRLLGVVPVVSASGPATARAQAQRYLSELFWAPHALAANPDLRWQELGEHAVEVTTVVAGSPVGIRIDFDDAGDISTVSTPTRARLVAGTAVDTAWAGRVADFATIGGIRVPTRAEVGWELPDGPFVYWQGTVSDVVLRYT
ncbi:DUF6544 family protein [Micromonospora profundi]|uniref:DUF6544 family protein n=1 Tax=Micromonospora profundi TaxID=1420889 RepID=UPI00369D3568